MRNVKRNRLEGLEARRLFADIADINWSGGTNETLATAQGPTAVVDQATSTYRVEGAVGTPDLADYFALRPNVTGTLSIKQTAWLTSTTPDWRLLNASGAELARKSAGTTTVSVAANTTVYLHVIGGATANQYYSWDVSLAQDVVTPTQQPYGAAPIALPARIEAENYDRGGQGIAYNDSTIANLGNNATYRSGDAVDLGTGETTANPVVGYIDAGEWLEYTVSVATAGSYTLTARVSSGVGGGAFRVESGATNLTGTISVASTGSWTTYTTLSKAVTLAAGTQVLRIYFEAAGWNLNWVEFARSTTPPTTDLGGVPAQRMARIGKGITIGRWFWTPQNVTPFATTGTANFLADSEIAALYKSGIRNLRLLVGPESLFNSTGNAQGDYDSAYRVFRDGNQRQEWYTSEVPASGSSLTALQAKWDAIKGAVRRISTVSNAAKTSTADTDMIVTLVPYEVAKTLEFGPYGGDTREPYRTNRFDNFANWLQAFSGRLLSGTNALTPEQVVFELMNEPSFFGQDAYWRDQQRKLINAVRANDATARFTIIASAPAGRADSVGDVRGLIGYDIDTADKGNVVYNCKFYEPGDIASQGADNLRTSDPSYVGWMHSLPWPASASSVASIIPGYTYGTPYNSAVAGYSTFLSYYNKYPWFYQDGARTPQQVADSLFSYGYGIDSSEPIPGYTGGSGYNLAFLRGRTQQLATWRTREQVPVLITEVGANASYAAYSTAASYGDGVNNDARSAYLRDVKTAFDGQNLGWVLWGYDDANAFGVSKVSSITGTTRASRNVPLSSLSTSGRLISNADGTFNLTRVDRDVLAAFGLNTSVTATTFARVAALSAAVVATSTSSRFSSATSELFGSASIL